MSGLKSPRGSVIGGIGKSPPPDNSAQVIGQLKATVTRLEDKLRKRETESNETYLQNLRDKLFKAEKEVASLKATLANTKQTHGSKAYAQAMNDARIAQDDMAIHKANATKWEVSNRELRERLAKADLAMQSRVSELESSLSSSEATHSLAIAALTQQHSASVSALTKRLTDTEHRLAASEKAQSSLHAAHLALQREHDSVHAQFKNRTAENEQLKASHAATSAAALAAAARHQREIAAASANAAAVAAAAATNSASSTAAASSAATARVGGSASAGGPGAGISTLTTLLSFDGELSSRRPGKAALGEPPISASAWARRVKAQSDKVRLAELELGEVQVALANKTTECERLTAQVRDWRANTEKEIAASAKRIRAAVKKEAEEAATEIDHLQSENALLKEMLHAAKVDVRRLVTATGEGGAAPALSAATTATSATLTRTITALPSASASASASTAATSVAIPPLPLSAVASASATATAAPATGDSSKSSPPARVRVPILSYGKLRGGGTGTGTGAPAPSAGGSPRSGRTGRARAAAAAANGSSPRKEAAAKSPTKPAAAAASTTAASGSLSDRKVLKPSAATIAATEAKANGESGRLPTISK